MAEATGDYNRKVLFRAQELGCDQAEATVWALIASARGISEADAEALDEELRDYVVARKQGHKSLDDLSALLALERDHT